MLFICVRSDLHSCVPMVASDRRSSGYGHGVVCCWPRCGLKYRDACQLSQEPLGDAEQVQDGALLEHGEELRACACEHSVSRESCCGRPCRSRIPLDGHCRNGLCCSEYTLRTSSCLPSKLVIKQDGIVFSNAALLDDMNRLVRKPKLFKI